MSEPSYTIDDLLTLMKRLREPVYGCPWDQVQTYQTIAPSTLEEAYEVVDAIEQGDKQQLREELGDLLFQVIFYSQLGLEDELFNFSDIVSELTAKLVRRHPHVFPDGTLASRIDPKKQENKDSANAQIKASWEKLKQNERREKGHQSIMDDIPRTLPAVSRAVKLQKRAASVGFDWQNAMGVYDKLAEELGELKAAQQVSEASAIEDELGDVLFTVINLSRHLKVDPETALRKANHKFEQRFRVMEQQDTAANIDFSKDSVSTMEARWKQAKQKIAAMLERDLQ